MYAYHTFTPNFLLGLGVGESWVATPNTHPIMIEKLGGSPNTHPIMIEKLGGYTQHSPNYPFFLSNF
jgi:hypothetical protein